MVLANTVVFVVIVSVITGTIAMNLFFNISAINVAGLTQYKSDDIIATTGVSIGENIFSVDTTGIEKALYDKYPYFEDVAVNRFLPNKLEILVSESHPQLVFINSDKQFTVVGGHSRVLEQGHGPYLGANIKVVGISLEDFPVGYSISKKTLHELEQKIATEKNADTKKSLREEYDKVEKALAMIELARRIQDAFARADISNITYIDVSENLSFKFFYDHRILVDFGTELDIDYKLRFFKEVASKLTKSFRGTLDMSVFSINSKVYTREQSVYQIVDEGYRGMYL